jgi:hypothetical protein
MFPLVVLALVQLSEPHAGSRDVLQSVRFGR